MSELPALPLNEEQIRTLSRAIMTDQRFHPDTLGELVRMAWVRWAEKQPSPKPSWLVPWSELGEADQEADRMIGITVSLHALAALLDIAYGQEAPHDA
jgi:hypothetical protein